MRRDRLSPYGFVMTRATPDPDPGRRPRDRIVDVLCFLLAVGFTVMVALDGGDPTGRLPIPVDVAIGAVCGLGVWVRRRWPVQFAVFAIGLSVVSVSAAWVVFIALFGVAVRRRAAVVGLVTAGATAACVASVLVGLDPTTPLWQAALSLVFFATVVAWGMFLRARRQLGESLRERERRAENDKLARVRRQERLRIAREMHDVLAHRISLVSLHAGALELRPDRPADEIARAAGVIRGSAHEALEELRAVIGVLRADPADAWADDQPDPLATNRAANRAVDDWAGHDWAVDDWAGHERAGREWVGREWVDGAPERPQPTLADLPGLAAEAREAGTRVELECLVTDPAMLPVAVGRNAYRIVQEGLTNARKHAHGTDVSVSVHGNRGDGLTVEVRNPCPLSTGPAVAIPGAGSGIVGLAERASLAGGWLEHGPTPAGDFELRAWLPWAA
jgi:signal transduction histidine kinase